MMNSHETWVRCWWWKFLIKVWENVLYFLFSDCVFICVSGELLFLSIFSLVLYICIKKVSVTMVIFHRIDIDICVFKADWIHFWLMTSNFILIWICVGCISVFLKSLGLDPFILLLLRRYSLADLFFYEKWSSEGTSL